MYTTSLQVSKKLHKLGIKEESEFFHTTDNNISCDRYNYEFYLYAYTIDELVPVLQKLGEIKGWENESESYFLESIFGKPKIMTIPQYHFCRMCELIADGHPEKVDEYLINLIEG